MGRRIRYANAALDATGVSFGEAARFMAALMLRNFATRGWVFRADGVTSLPGCIVASPSRPDGSDVTDQDYLFFWVRDGAICALEAAHANLPTGSLLDDHVAFCKLVSARAAAAGKTAGHACFRIDGEVRPWSEQSDGPAMRIVSLLEMRAALSPGARADADALVRADLEYLLDVHGGPTTNLWEETLGRSFFARAVQLRALRSLQPRLAELQLLPHQARISQACDALVAALAAHWVPGARRYRSVLEDGRGADLDVDVVMAAVYGDLPCTDPKLLSTAAQLRDAFSALYPIVAKDAERGIGPVVGRYPEDTYDGDLGDPTPDVGHPWPLCTCNFAELYYRVAREAGRRRKLAVEGDAVPFFRQVGIEGSGTLQGAPLAQAVGQLESAGDRMLRAVLYHSDQLELSEQFDRDSGYEKSVRNLTWSYASFLSAVRARGAI
ncbi:MAG TPA: glycoside hydrolase family 15 protein [Anaeromyxobacteraceae bacterium]|nr:glycoside hydrolase family 15 protein [Anaeromyxobacteraceae bacterium]